jgi:mRNA-degrading endonuclease toxin of MazEF toxin-antitoxin module
MTIGEIHWVELPDSGGREQAGRRPAIVIQNDDYAGSLPMVLVVPLSNAIAALRFPGTAPIKADKSSGLRIDSELCRSRRLPSCVPRSRIGL